MEILIKTFTNEGDLVLDCFSGSGSTLVAAKRLGRDFVGTEIDKNFHKISSERISRET